MTRTKLAMLLIALLLTLTACASPPNANTAPDLAVLDENGHYNHPTIPWGISVQEAENIIGKPLKSDVETIWEQANEDSGVEMFRYTEEGIRRYANYYVLADAMTWDDQSAHALLYFRDEGKSLRCIDYIFKSEEEDLSALFDSLCATLQSQLGDPTSSGEQTGPMMGMIGTFPGSEISSLSGYSWTCVVENEISGLNVSKIYDTEGRVAVVSLSYQKDPKNT